MIGKDLEIERSQAISENFSSELIIKSHSDSKTLLTSGQQDHISL